MFSFIYILILSMFAADVVWWLWADRALRPLRKNVRWRVGLHVFMALQMSSLVFLLGGRAAGYRMEQYFPSILLTLIFLWHFILLPVGILVVILFGSIDGLALAVRKTMGTSKPPRIGLSRREFLGAATSVAIPIANGAATGIAASQLSDFRLRSFELGFANLPPELDGLRIAQVSDIHVGRFTTGRVLKKIVESTNALRADLVLLTGDLINSNLSDLASALDSVKRMDAQHGVYLIEGNHDLFEGREAFGNGVRAAGVPLLVNESTLLQVRGRSLQLLGLQWGPGRGDAGIRESMRKIETQLDPSAFQILMAHHPHAFDEAARLNIPLTFSGHTHGGQLMLPGGVGFGPMMYRYWSGLYEKLDTKLVVSNGVGNWFPLRINAPAEIILINLRAGR